MSDLIFMLISQRVERVVAVAKPPKRPKPEEIETEPDAWERFERAVDAVVKSGPKHRVTPKSHKPKGEATNKPGK